MHVLYAEDDADLRGVVLPMFDRLGHTVVVVDKAELILVELSRGTFDLIFTDNDTKSEMTGLTVVTKIRRDPFFKEIANIPIVVQTSDAIEQEVLELNAVFLAKPYRRAQLTEALDKVVLQQTGSIFR